MPFLFVENFLGFHVKNKAYASTKYDINGKYNLFFINYSIADNKKVGGRIFCHQPYIES